MLFMNTGLYENYMIIIQNCFPRKSRGKKRGNLFYVQDKSQGSKHECQDCLKMNCSTICRKRLDIAKTTEMQKILSLTKSYGLHVHIDGS